MSISRRAFLAVPAVPLLLSQARAQCSGVNITVNGSSQSPTVLAGMPLAIAVFNGPAKPTDWVGISLVETPDDAVIERCYLNGAQTPPPVGLRFANFTMTAPANMWIYEARLYFENTFSILARATFVVHTA
jgi:hypothetical protein